jgi:hypothetical protein
MLRLAEVQRHEFIQLFLQGRWCEARGMFELSLESYLYQDDFCGAANNHLIFWKLKQYVGIDTNSHLEFALELQSTGQQCPEPGLPVEKNQSVQATVLPDKDAEYMALLSQEKFDLLFRLLARESDPLYASVYGRKAALAALNAGQPVKAKILVQQAQERDARQGWVVFLIEDWKIIHALTADTLLQREILFRIQHLQELIQPCQEQT